ncbi:MAG: DUF2085 domain-containing protein [Clostridia bacterium]|nr:DUF2085 domain-containing protein [Clostridia bacterium]
MKDLYQGDNRAIRACYKWLPIFCGCHQRADRSFFVKGQQMPVCARCEGELIGMIAGLILIFFVRPDFWVPAVLMVPMIADGLIQNLGHVESTNVRRLVTGLLFGYGLMTLIAKVAILCFNYGWSIGEGIVN